MVTLNQIYLSFLPGQGAIDASYLEVVRGVR